MNLSIVFREQSGHGYQSLSNSELADSTLAVLIRRLCCACLLAVMSSIQLTRWHYVNTSFGFLMTNCSITIGYTVESPHPRKKNRISTMSHNTFTQILKTVTVDVIVMSHISVPDSPYNDWEGLGFG